MSSVLEVNPRVLGIRAPSGLQTLAERITDEIRQGAKKPFSKVIDVSACDPHRTGMAPITFVRQVLAACLYPDLLAEERLPPDVRQRADKLLDACCGRSVGSYSATTTGIPDVKESVAQFIMRRDAGVTSDPENIIIKSGSQTNLSMVLNLMASGEGETRTGVLTPVPYPHALPMLLDVHGVTPVPYQLLENRGWALDVAELRRALETARGRCQPRALYISNPGNPTGHVQDEKTIQEVIRFAAAEGLVLLADEVNQDSVFGRDREFVSYRQVLCKMGRRYSDTVELISFNSLSSAIVGECGQRGGYMEALNLDPAVYSHLKKLPVASSPPILPQLCLEMMVNPPSPGDPSYETYTQEVLHIRSTLSQNARRACDFLNDLPGMSCQPAMAGVFLYPGVRFPPQMMEEAKMSGLEPDVLYCQRMLEEEGVCLGTGHENGHEDQNYHIRLCVLAPPAALEEVLARLRSFHLHLLDRFP